MGKEKLIHASDMIKFAFPLAHYSKTSHGETLCAYSEGKNKSRIAFNYFKQPTNFNVIYYFLQEQKLAEIG